MEDIKMLIYKNQKGNSMIQDDEMLHFQVKITTTTIDWNQEIEKDTHLFCLLKNQRTSSKNPTRMLILIIGKYVERSYFNFSLNNIAE